MLGGVLVLANGVGSENPLDIIDAESPHKMVFLLVDLSLRIARCSMCLSLVYLTPGMQQNMVLLQVYFVVLVRQFLELDVEWLYLREHFSVNNFVRFLIL